MRRRLLKPEYRVRKSIEKAVQRTRDTGIDLSRVKVWALQLLHVEAVHAREHLERVDHVVARVGLPNHFDLFPHVIVLEPIDANHARTLEREIDRITIQSMRETGRSQDNRAYAFPFWPESNHRQVTAVALRGDLSGRLSRISFPRSRRVTLDPWSIALGIRRYPQETNNRSNPNVHPAMWQMPCGVA